MNPATFLLAASALVGLALMALGLRRPSSSGDANLSATRPDPPPGAGGAPPAFRGAPAEAPLSPLLSLIARDGADECARLAITYGDIEGLSAQWEAATVATKTGNTHIAAADSGTLNDRDNAAEAAPESGAAFSTAQCAVTIPAGS
ncbi:MAG: hypothetical protein F4078_11245 [Acidimicrobiia bacterium]|nr:hypothetical protein [bacterium]MXZ29913.1 hypothetical protein [Acidimicrobiia bacterium]MYB24351.1 hypothetical protein [Acidimicrobiia bacterium]MYJ14844.1 hypothetical protein [Acidimicrobiia bacterium]